MAWFGRKRREPGDGQPSHGAAPPPSPGDSAPAAGPPDDVLTFLSVDEANRLRAEVRTALAEQGYEVVVHADHVVTDDGRQLGLWNIAAKLNGVTDPQERRLAIAQHYRPLFTDASAELTGEDFLAALRLRLVETSSLGQLGGADHFDHGVEWADSVLRIPVIDLPETVQIPTRSTLDEHGVIGPLLDRAWRNTEAAVATEEMEEERLDYEGCTISVVSGPSVYIASLAVFLPALIHRFHPGADLSRGVVLAVPARSRLAYRVVEEGRAVMDALMLIPRFAVGAYSDGVGPVSPHTYLWRDGEVEQLTAITADSTLQVRPGPHLEPYLTDLGESDHR